MFCNKLQKSYFNQSENACPDLMQKAFDLQLPKNAYWGIENVNKIDSFIWQIPCIPQCLDKNTVFLKDFCVPQQSELIYNDFCQQIPDCYNCSVIPECIWQDNVCTNLNKACKNNSYLRNTNICPSLNYPKEDYLLLSFYAKFQQCKPLQNICPNSLQSMKPIEKEKVQLGVEKDPSNNLKIPQNAFCSWGVLNEKSYEHLNFKVKSDFFQSGSKIDAITKSITASQNDPAKDYDQLWAYSLNFDMSSKSSSSYEVYFYAMRVNLLFQQSVEVNPSRFSFTFDSTSKLFHIENWLEWAFLILLIIFITCSCCLPVIKRVLICLNSRYHLRILDSLQLQAPEIQETAKERWDRLLKKKYIESIEYTPEISETLYTTECSFCLENFKNKEKLARFFCNHVYHLECVQAWNIAETRPLKCPMCQQPFPVKGEELDSGSQGNFGRSQQQSEIEGNKKESESQEARVEFFFQNEELNDEQKLDEELIQKNLNQNSKGKKMQANQNFKQEIQADFSGSYYQFENQL